MDGIYRTCVASDDFVSSTPGLVDLVLDLSRSCVAAAHGYWLTFGDGWFEEHVFVLVSFCIEFCDLRHPREACTDLPEIRGTLSI